MAMPNVPDTGQKLELAVHAAGQVNFNRVR